MMERKSTEPEKLSAGSYIGFVLAAGLALSSCTTSGGNVFSDAAPKSADGQTTDDSAGSGTGVQNPNARTRIKNTRSALSEYCPAVRIRAGTESIRVFKRGADKSKDENLRYQATITKVARECNYTGDSLEIRVGAVGRVITGPGGGSGAADFPIRVAIQQGGCVRHFELHKQQAAVASGKTFGTFEFVDQTVSIPAPTSTNVRVFVGFDETPNSKPSAKRCA